MVNLTTSVALATATSFLALSTPYVSPSGCTPFYRTTTTESTYTSWSNNLVSYTVTSTTIFEDPTDQRFITCQPPGWDTVVTSMHFTFSPAVCPSGWIAYDLRTADRRSLAYCCQSGFTPAYLYSGFSTTVCLSSSSVLGALYTTTSYTYTLTSTRTLYSASFVHPAWEIMWKQTDQATLSPRPPTLTSKMYIPTWTPGTEVDGKKYEDSYYYGGHSDSSLQGLPLLIGLATGLPAFFIGLCCCCCCCSRSEKRKARKLAAANAAAGIEGGAEGQDTELETRTPGDAERGRPSADEHLPPYSPSSPDLQNHPPAYADTERLSQTLARDGERLSQDLSRDGERLSQTLSRDGERLSQTLARP